MLSIAFTFIDPANGNNDFDDQEGDTSQWG